MSRKPANASRAKCAQHRLIVAIALVFVCIVPSLGYAQMVVSDPANQVQNSATALSTAKNALTQMERLRRQIEQYKIQVQQLHNDVQNLKNLNPKSWDDLQRGFFLVVSLIERSRMLYEDWRRFSQSRDEVYGAYVPNETSGPVYWAKRLIWQLETDKAIRDAEDQENRALKAHGDIAKQSHQLADEAKAVRGNLQAAELNAKIQGVQMRQSQVFHDAMLHDMRARRIHKLELRRKAQAERRVQLNLLGRGMGTFKSKARPVPFPKFKSRWF